MVYADPAGAERTVLLFGGTTLLWHARKDLDILFDLLSDDTGAVSGLHEVPAGELGGVMKCGSSAARRRDLAVCGWADHGSVVMAMFPGRPDDDAGALLRDLRGAMQIQSGR